MNARKDLPVDMGGVFRTWDPMTGRYEGIHGSAPVGMFYCCIGSDGTVQGLFMDVKINPNILSSFDLKSYIIVKFITE